MKYEFDLNVKKDHYELLISLTYNNSLGKAQKTLIFDENLQSFENVLGEIIDDMRLTVKERENVRNNAAVLTDYLKYYKAKNNINPEVQINENDLIDNIDLNKVDDDVVINDILNEDDDEIEESENNKANI